jgi:hypothetical protein
MHKHTYEGYKTMIKVEIKLLQPRFKDFKIEKRKMLQKIAKALYFSGSVYLDDVKAFVLP